MLRWSALASIADPPAFALALVAAHAAGARIIAGRSCVSSHQRATDGDCRRGRRTAARGSRRRKLPRGGRARSLSRPAAVIIGLLLLSSAGILTAWLSVKQIGGQSGDVLGALEQVNEILILLTAAALLRV